MHIYLSVCVFASLFKEGTKGREDEREKWEKKGRQVEVPLGPCGVASQSCIKLLYSASQTGKGWASPGLLFTDLLQASRAPH